MKSDRQKKAMPATEKQQQQASQEMVIKEAMKRRIPQSGGDRGREVLNALVEIIEAAGLKAGDRLPPEKELAQSLGVGRSSIREALMAWQRMGIVVRNKGAGTRLVAKVSSQSVQLPLTIQLEAEGLARTLTVRRPLEFEATRLAIQNGTEKDMRIISARCEELMAIFEAGENWHEADARFHAAIHDASGNPLFGQLIQQLHSAFHDAYQAPFDKPQMADRSIPLHRDLADAVKTRDWEAAKRTLQEIFAILEVEVANTLDENR